MGTNSDYFSALAESQERMLNSWLEATKMWQRTVTGQTGNGVREAEEVSTDLFDTYSSLLASAAESVNKARDYNLDILTETIAKSMSGSNLYLRLYEMWLPVLQAMQERALDVEAYQDLLNPARYREVLDRVYGFSPEATLELYNQATRALHAFTTSSTDYLTPWAAATARNAKLVPRIAEGHPESFIEAYRNLFDAFDKTYGALFRAPAVGKDRERIELLFGGVDDLTRYLAKNTEYQYALYQAGVRATERIIESAAERIRQGDIKSFNEFFSLWISENEKEFMKLSATDAFSRLQGEVLNAGLKARQRFSKLMELYLEDYPVVVRSEMDDLYKTVYDLKRKVKDLEKQIKTSAL